MHNQLDYRQAAFHWKSDSFPRNGNRLPLAVVIQWDSFLVFKINWLNRLLTEMKTGENRLSQCRDLAHLTDERRLAYEQADHNGSHIMSEGVWYYTYWSPIYLKCIRTHWRSNTLWPTKWHQWLVINAIAARTSAYWSATYWSALQPHLEFLS